MAWIDALRILQGGRRGAYALWVDLSSHGALMATLGALPVRWLLVMLDAFLSLAIARHYLVMLGLLDLFAMLAKLLELQGQTLVGAAADGIRQRLGAVGIHLGLMPGAGHGHVNRPP